MNASLIFMEIVNSLRTSDTFTFIAEVPTYEFWRLHRVSAGGNET